MRRRFLEQAPNEDRRVGHAQGPVDGLGSIGIASRIDVRGILRPDDELGVGMSGLALAGHPGDGDLDVVVQYRAALGVEVQAGPGDVALDGHDPRRRALDRQRHREPDEGADHRGEGGGDRLSNPRPLRPRHPFRAGRTNDPVCRASGIPEETSTQRDEEGDRGGAGDGGDVGERAVGLAERQADPGEPAVGDAVAQRLLGDPGQAHDQGADGVPLKDGTPQPSKQRNAAWLTARPAQGTTPR